MKILIRSENADGVSSWDDLCDPDHSFSAEVFALYSALKSPEQWMSDFHALLSESISILNLLGIISIRSTDIQSIPQVATGGKDSESSHIQTHACDNRILNTLRQHVPSYFSQLKSGKQRVSYLTRMFHSMSTLIQQLNLSVFLTAFSAVMGYWKTENVHDPVNAIENERGISPLDLQTVVTFVKMSMLQVASQIMYVNPPHIMRYGTAFLRPVLSLVAQMRKKKSATRVSAAGYTLLTLALQFLALSAASLPNALSDQINSSHSSRNSNSNMNIHAELLELFRDEVVFLTSERSSLLVTTNSNTATGNSSGESADLSAGRSLLSSKYCAFLVELFNAVESLLLHCGGLLLSSAVIAHIDASVGLGLVALCKGVLPPQFAERRLQRFPCELIRSNPELQFHFLRLSTAAVLASQSSRAGGLNGNLAIFRSACTNCLSHPLTKGQAVLGLSILHALLTPTGAVPLPAVSTVETARVFLEASRRSTEIDSSISMELGTVQNKRASSDDDTGTLEEDRPALRKQRLDDNEIGLDEESRMVSQDEGDAAAGDAHASIGVDSAEEVAVQKDQTASNQASTQQLEHTDKKKMQPIIRSRIPVSENAVVSGGRPSDSDDDMELPDIDIDADPDT
eukprot:gene23530-31882_t